MKTRYGLMRARQFIMKDLYTFDVDLENAEQTYSKVCESYHGILNELQVNFIKGNYSLAFAQTLQLCFHTIKTLG